MLFSEFGNLEMRNQRKQPVLIDARESSAEGPIRVGKDEMNLAEFPISLLTNHVPDDQTMVEFKDRYFDDVSGKTITRCVTITAAPEPVKYFEEKPGRTGATELVENPEKIRFRSGLPRAVDDDVLLGLIQLTKQVNGFTSPEVRFSRMGLIRLLGWPDSGKSFKRLDESLQRWVSVTLKYENAWRDNRGKRWLSDSFHILDNVQLNDSRTSDASGDLFPSMFRWNVRVFDSFQAGYLKSINYPLYKSLKYQTSKRMYRYLSKRMYHKNEVELSLVDFAIGHVGLSSSYAGNAGKLKEKLKDGLEELESVGFLEPAEKDERYRKDGKVWNIRLKHRDVSLSLVSPAPEPPPEPESPCVAALEQHGVTRSTALELVKSFEAQRIDAQLEHLAWFLETKPKKIADPAAWLVSAIKADHAAPKGFVSVAEKARRAASKQAEQDRHEAERQSKLLAERNERRLLDQVKTFRERLTPKEAAQLEADAIAQASDDVRTSLEEPALARFRSTQVEGIIRSHVRMLLLASMSESEMA